MTQVRVPREISYLLPPDQRDRVGATHSCIPAGATVEVAHEYEDGTVVLAYRDDLVLTSKSSLDPEPPSQPHGSLGVPADDIPF